MIGLISSLLPVVSSVLDRVLPDTVEKDKVKAELQAQMLQHSASIEKAAADVVVAEAKGESWLQRNWRPVTMMSFVTIVVNNYIMVPWLNVFGLPAVALDIPPDMWSLLQIGIGGYIFSRGAEKGIKTWRDGDSK
tara:strand:- start:579 stop:983 length:405 start_codon:yes stop_codon:yes gene_type:complete